MELFKFTSALGGKDAAAPPFRIPARALDENFAKLTPLKQDGNARQYLLTETPEGWTMKIFPDFPSGTGLFVLGYREGSLQWVATENC